ncbi:putative surface anchored protein [Lachnospiraceae bacterium PM6-15]
MSKLVRQVTAMLLAILTFLSIVPVGTVSAAPGDIGTATFSIARDGAGNPICFNSGAVINGNQTGGTGEYRWRIFINGQTAFCIQPGVRLYNGDQVRESASATWNALSEHQQKAIGLSLLYGYQGNRGALSGSDDEKWVATQILVWEFATGFREATGNYNQNNGTLYNIHFGPNYGNAGTKVAYNQILSMMQNHNKIPSFMSGNASAITKDMGYKDGKYSVSYTDSNGVLSGYNFSSSNANVKVNKSGNTLTITSTEAISGTARITATRNNVPRVSESAKLIAYGDPVFQDVVTGVENAAAVSAYINVKTPTGTIALKKTSEDGVVEGISFHIKGERYDKTLKTAKDGSISVAGMYPGEYTITEANIDRYVPQKSQTIMLVGGKTTTVTFSNTLKRGSVKVIKNSEDKLVEGVKFRLYGKSLSGHEVNEYAVTGKDGVAEFKNVLISGNTPYTMEEVDTAIRYVVPASQSTPVEWGKVTNRTFNNVLKKFRVTVTKTDKETGKAQGDATLGGATYGLFKGETLIKSYTTDDKGQFTTDYYVCGDDWTIRETNPSEGYLLDKTIHKVGAKPELYTVERNSVKNMVTEQVIKGKVAIIKHTDDGSTGIETPEKGATFEVYLKAAGSYAKAKESERDTLVCDKHGFAESKNMPYGIYTMHQTKGWDGRELIKDFDVFINSDGEIYRFIINNANFKSYIKVVKKDAETGKTIPYAGAGFQIYDPQGKLVTMTFTYPEVTKIDTFYTTAEGQLITPQTLEYGKGYTLVEVQAPYGYVLNSEPILFDVVQENSEDEDGITVIEVVRSNMAQKGKIVLNKTGETFSSVSENGGLYQPIYIINGLPGATYEVRAAEDIITTDGTKRASKGNLVDTVTTATAGVTTSKELYLGKYEVKEVKAPAGMTINEDIHIVELVYAGQEVEVTEAGTSFYNERQKVKVTLEKVMEQDEDFGIGMNGELASVTFGLYAAVELKASDETIIPVDGLLEYVTVNEKGEALCKTDLPFGSYYLKEIATDGHYLISDEKYPVTFEYVGQDTALVEIKVNDEKAIENKLIRAEIEGLKVGEDGEGLEGAVIGLFRSDVTEYTEEQAIKTATSDKDGRFSFAQVPYGDYVIREIESPTGYVLTEESFPVSVNEDGIVIEIEIANEKIRGDIRLTKVDKEYPDNKLTGAEFEVYEDTNGNKKLDKEDKLLGKLEENATGIYEMLDLEYGGYLVKETKAPDGFYLDKESYYVFIEEDGKVYDIENEAGVGFVNSPRVGSLKIIKTSSDNKVEGFSFKVTGPNGYDQVFKTNGKGEIIIENLRIGEYTVSEVQDGVSNNYILPDDQKVTVLDGETVDVEMFNELRDTPKTGDDSNPRLWLFLTGLGVVGVAVSSVLIFKKRKKGEVK